VVVRLGVVVRSWVVVLCLWVVVEEPPGFTHIDWHFWSLGHDSPADTYLPFASG
jgi:hypothetical protein